MKKQLNKIAEESADEFLIQLRQWLGFDLQPRVRTRLVKSIKEAVNKSLETQNAETVRYIELIGGLGHKRPTDPPLYDKSTF